MSDPGRRVRGDGGVCVVLGGPTNCNAIGSIVCRNVRAVNIKLCRLFGVRVVSGDWTCIDYLSRDGSTCWGGAFRREADSLLGRSWELKESFEVGLLG